MAWTKPTEQNLAGTLSQREIDAFRASPAASMAADPVADTIAAAVDLARGYCRSNGNLRLGPAGTIPRSLLSPVLDIAAFNILKRLPVPVNEDRRKANEEAMRILRDVAEGRTTPEGHGEAEDAAAGTVAVTVAVSSRRRVTPAKLEGL